MTIPAHHTEEKRPRTKKRGGLYHTDAEIIEEVQVPEKIAREVITALDRDHARNGFPQKQPLWGGYERGVEIIECR